jgi:hypothetical protein
VAFGAAHRYPSYVLLAAPVTGPGCIGKSSARSKRPSREAGEADELMAGDVIRLRMVLAAGSWLLVLAQVVLTSQHVGSIGARRAVSHTEYREG